MANEKDKNLEKEQELALFENQKIVDVGMEREVKKSFIEYSNRSKRIPVPTVRKFAFVILILRQPTFR